MMAVYLCLVSGERVERCKKRRKTNEMILFAIMDSCTKKAVLAEAS